MLNENLYTNQTSDMKYKLLFHVWYGNCIKIVILFGIFFFPLGWTLSKKFCVFLGRVYLNLDPFYLNSYVWFLLSFLEIKWGNKEKAGT